VPPEIVSRYDVATLGNAERTPQGFLRVPAYLTRAGILEYKRHDGTTVRELRPASEVFAPKSLATLRAAPVTDLHPTEMVSPKNVRSLSIGHVSEDVQRADGDLVAGALTLQAETAIAAVESGARRELSCGYRCRIDATPGTFEGKPYDQVQRDIVYNHVALGPRNWGRAGREIALRIDSQGSENDQPPTAADAQLFRLDAADALSVAAVAPQRAKGIRTMETTTIEIDGLQTEVPRDAAKRIQDAIEVRTDALGEAVIDKEAADGKVVELTARIAELELYIDGEQSRFDAWVVEHADTLASARKVLPDERFDGKSTEEIQAAVIGKLRPKIDLAKKTTYERAAIFETLTSDDAATGTVRNDAIDQSRRVLAPQRAPAGPAAAPKPFVPDWQRSLSTSRRNQDDGN